MPFHTTQVADLRATPSLNCVHRGRLKTENEQSIFYKTEDNQMTCEACGGFITTQTSIFQQRTLKIALLHWSIF